MAKAHDAAARRIAHKLGGSYDPQKSPDVKGSKGRAEVKSKAEEIPTALKQLGGGPGRAYVALPKSEHSKAMKALEGRKTGLMDYKGNIAKRSTRKSR